MRVCANDECGIVFEPKAHNAIYHSAECRRVVTNKRILEKYYESKERITEQRICVTKKCTTILSIYNEEEICEACKSERLLKRLKSWGWDIDALKEEWKW